jgi:hypothetical protein
METTPSPSSKFKFDSTNEIETRVEKKLKRRYGRGIFVDKYDDTTETVTIILGNVVPKDVSDCRDRDRVLKYISYKPIYKLTAEPTTGGYEIELPERDEIYEGFIHRRQAVARRLDASMARTIYEELIEFTPVENQLGAVKKILRVVRKHQPVEVDDIFEMRGSDSEEQTEKYLSVLRDTGFLTFQDNKIYTGPELDAHDIHDIRSKEFSKLVLGQVIQKAYHTLKDELNLTLLAHYPKFAGSYYFSAIKREEPGLRLDLEAITRNLRTVYGDERTHKYDAEIKLDDLADVGVLERENGFYKANKDVYSELVTQRPV